MNDRGDTMKRMYALLTACVMLLTGCSLPDTPNDDSMIITESEIYTEEISKDVAENKSMLSFDTTSEEYINSLEIPDSTFAIKQQSIIYKSLIFY